MTKTLFKQETRQMRFEQAYDGWNQGRLTQADALIEGARFNDEIHRLPAGNSTFIPKGVYRFKTHDDANRHQQDCFVAGMAKIARERA